MSDTQEIQFISIVSRWNPEGILYRGQHATLREALLAAVASGAYLGGAYLSGANLRGADLSDADLSGANLRGADLSDADLSGADLSGADLSDANLSDANLSDADLSGADLRAADLSGANLRGADLSDADLSGADLRAADLSGADLRAADLSDANLRGANLRGADLSDAYLSGADLTRADLGAIRNTVPNLVAAKADLWSILDLAPAEVPAVREALIAGRVDGSTYSGSCSCLIGTIATARGCSEYGLGNLKPNSDRPAEQFFMRIRPGHVPAVNYHAALAVLWIDEWTATRKTEASDGQ